MAQEHATVHRPASGQRMTPPSTIVPSPAVRRAAVVASRTAPGGPAPHPAVYAPWQQLLAKADARFKIEITDAVRQLEAATAEAGQILDRQAAMAAEAAGALETAAWAAWERLMSAADDTRNSVLDKARAEYDGVISRAHGQYQKSLDDALRTYQGILSDVSAAQAAAKVIAT